MEVDKTIIATPLQFEVLNKISIVLLLREYDTLGLRNGWSCQNELISIKSFSREDEAILDEKSNALIIIDKFNLVGEQDDENHTLSEYELKFHLVSGNNTEDWKLVINDFIKKSNRQENKYAINYLLWLLNKDWSEIALRNALYTYPRECVSFVLDTIQKISKILSVDKQQSIQSLFLKFGRNYSIHNHQIIRQAVEQMIPYGEANYTHGIYINNLDKQNAIGLVNMLHNIYLSNKNSQICNDSDNSFIHLFYWLDNENEPLGDYDILISLFSYLTVALQRCVIKRYFHDIRNGHTTFSSQLIECLKDNQYSYITIWRECLYPNKGKDITIPLLLDSLLNVYKKNAIQTYNGVLDLAISNSNPYAPNITVKWHSIFPCCKEAGLVNSRFKGFIDYLYEGRFDEQKLNDDNEILLYIDELLSNYNKINGTTTLNKKNDNILCQILFSPVELQTLPTEDIQFDIKRISSFRTISDNIRKIAEKVSATSYRITPRNLKYVEKFFITERILIKPRVYEDINLNIYQYNASTGFYHQVRTERLKSKDDVERHIINSLEDELKQQYNGNYFELSGHDANKLDVMLKLYYYNFDVADNQNSDNFLYSPKANNSLCCPQLAKLSDAATGLSYYMCNGKHCFHNALKNQVIVNETDWRKYTFFHYVEIMGYPMMHKLEASYEPDEEVRRFTGLVRKAIKKYNTIQCKSCGHLMFPNKSNSNNYTYFACKNPDCPEYNQSYYINTCFYCKELIDARESTKCPNGRYICSSCLACCDDEQFEREISNTVRRYKSIPFYYQNLRGKGHNNKGIFYCPYCSIQVNEINRDQENIVFQCPNCGKTYSRRIKWD